jgi:GntR family transcriptional regulator
MPSEDALALELGVSRASVRSALGNLTTAGYLRRRHGDGTYPCPNVFEIGIRSDKIWDIMRQIEESGRKAELRSLEQKLRPAKDDEAAILSIPAGETILSMRRLFLADGKPVAVIANILRVCSPDCALPEDAPALSPFEALACFCGSPLEEASVCFTAILADEPLARELRVPAGSPLLKLYAEVFDPKGVPLISQSEYYPGDEGFRLRAKLIL